MEAVGTLLGDETFLARFPKRFPAKRGRYMIPMEDYLRLMYLKRRYQLGSQSLVSDRERHRQLASLLSDQPHKRVPDASTLIRLTNRPCQGLELEFHQEIVRAL